MLVPANSQRRRACSVIAKFLARPLSMIHSLGPMITPFAEVPNWPGVGGPNAPTLNQSLIDCWPAGRLGFESAFGRMVTCAGVVLLVLDVPVGSLPVHKGVRN